MLLIFIILNVVHNRNSIFIAGFVNKKSINHIGVLVHKTFNISILKPEDDEEWPGDNVRPGQEVRFTLTEINYISKIPFFRGVLKEE